MDRRLKRKKGYPAGLALPSLGCMIVVAVFCLSFCRCGRPSSRTRLEERLVDQYDSASYLVNKGDFSHALPIYYDMASLYSDSLSFNEKELCAAALNNAGYIEFFEMGHDSLAYSNLMKALEIGEQIGSEKVLGHIYLNITSLRNSYTATPTMQDLTLTSFNYALKGKRWEELSIIYVNTLWSGFFSETPPEDIDHLTRMFRNVDGVDSVPIGRYAKGMMRSYEAFRRKDYGESVRLLRNSVRHLDGVLDGRLYKVNNLYLQAQVHDVSEMPDSALEDVRKGIAFANSSSIPHLAINGYSYLSQLFEKKGMPDSAQTYKLKYLEIVQTSKSTSNFNAINEMQRTYEQNTHDSQLRVVSGEKEELVGVTVIVGVAFIVACVFIVIFILRNRRLRRHNAEIYAKWKEKTASGANAVVAMAAPGGSDVMEMTEEAAVDDPSQEKPDVIDSVDAGAVCDGIRRVFGSNEIYSPDFSLSTLASLLSVKERYLSAIISKYYGKSLPALVAEARVSEACRRFDHWSDYSHLTLFGLAQQLGFKSGSVFSTTFRKITGLSPKEYLRQANKKSS